MSADRALKRVGELYLGFESRDGAPKYRRLFNAFAEAVREGTFAPGDRLPNEADVADTLPVSLGTVQKALSQLSLKGIVVRNRRSGTFVRDWKTRAEDAFIYRFSDPATGRPIAPMTRAISVSEDQSGGPWRDLFGDSEIVRLERFVWVEHDAPAFSQVFLPIQFGGHLLTLPIGDLHGISYHRMLAETSAPPPLEIKERLYSGVLSPEALRNLLLPEGTQGIYWDIEEYSFNDEPLVFQRIQLPPGHRPLELNRRVQHG